MIQRVSHMTVFCLDQDKAKDFYVNTLGFEVREDQTMGGFRWLTVAPKGQQIEMILMPIVAGPMIDAENVAALRRLIEKGMIGAGVLLTDDAQKTYEELSAKGVTFKGPPAERPYGIELLMSDVSGLWYSVVQRPR